MDAVQLLKQDHAEVASLFEEFEDADSGRKATIARQICRMLTVHAQIEEELLYPAAREALEEDDTDLVDEAVVEHATLKSLVGQIEASGEQDQLYDAKVTVLCEYVKHHVKEEEGQLFPKLEKSELDLDELGEELAARKAELLGGSSDESMASAGGAGRRGSPADADRGSRTQR